MYRFAIDNFRCNPDMIIVIVSRAIVIRTHGNNQIMQINSIHFH